MEIGALLLTLVLGLFFLIGIAVVKFSRNPEQVELYSIGIALGAMVGIALLDIMPEMIEETQASKAYLPVIGIIIGFFLLVILDKFIPEHEDEDEKDYSNENMVHIGMISSIAIVLHNIIEGMAVYTIGAGSVKAGIILMIGIGLHNIPMGMFIYSTLHTKLGWKKNLIIGMSVVSTFIGGIIMMILNGYAASELGMDALLLGMAMGMIVYIVVLELIPYIRKNKSKMASKWCALIGFAVVLISTFLEVE